MEERHAGQDRTLQVFGGSVLVGVVLLFVALIGRLVHINTALSGKLEPIVERQQGGSVTLPARRGNILDARGRVVAGTCDSPSIFADPYLIDDIGEAARRVAPIVGRPAADVGEALRAHRDSRFNWLRRHVEEADAKAVRALGIRGISVQLEPRRFYSSGALMGPVLGIVGRDGEGLEGVELQYDEHLRGTPGTRVSIHDGGLRRTPIWAHEGMSQPPVDGGHVRLTLDMVIQGYVESVLTEAVAEFEADSAVGVVMVPDTGAVLAMGQVPSFDPNRYQAFASSARRNRVICDALEPGSSFKPFVASGALLAGVVAPGEEFFCHNGVHYFGGRRLRDSSPHGVLTFEGIIAKSSNIGMGILGERMGNAAIYNIVRAFGFGAKTGVAFPGESAGLVRPLESWSGYSTTSVPIGQEIAVTPLQLATGFCAIVNGGRLMRPRLVEALLSHEGAVVASLGPREVRRVLPVDVADYMTRTVLVGAVTDGGGHAAALEDWQVVGKTGTAQVSEAGRRGYVPDAYTGCFLGAAPASHPRVAVLVMVHRPNREIGYYGTTVAAPAVGEILRRTLLYLEVPADSHRAM